MQLAGQLTHLLVGTMSDRTGVHNDHIGLSRLMGLLKLSRQKLFPYGCTVSLVGPAAKSRNVEFLSHLFPQLADQFPRPGETYSFSYSAGTFYLTVKVSVLGSGSSGNCSYIATENTCILVDLGFGWRSLGRRLHQVGLHRRKIDAVLLTHGHCDHVSGVHAFLSRHPVPIFMNEGTREEVPELQNIDGWESFSSDASFSIGDLHIEAFTVSHDAAEPVGFRFSAQGITGALLTDLGELTDPVIRKLSGCDWLIVESNYDEPMLKIGPYPWSVKQRVLSNIGHLSNQELSTFFTHHFDGHTAHIFLAHLSRRNNDPGIALGHASRALSQHFPLSAKSRKLHLTYQNKPSLVLTL